MLKCKGSGVFCSHLVVMAMGLFAVTTQPVLAQSNDISDYVPFFGTSSTTNYKTIYNPEGVINNTSGEILLSATGSNFNRYMNRAFVPPGARRLYFSFSTYGDGESKVAVAYAAPPSLGLNDITLATASAVNASTVLSSLLQPVNTKGLPFYAAPTASYIYMSTPLSYDVSNKTAVGQWVYSRVLELTGEYISYSSTLNIAGFSMSVAVDLRCYKSWYSRAVRENWFDASGNPIQTLNGQTFYHQVEEADKAYCGDTSTGTTPTTPIATSLTAITLSQPSLIKGSADLVRITPVPSNASLGVCRATTNTNLVNVVDNVISLASGASSITTNTLVTIACGSASQSLTIVPNTVSLTGITLSQNSLVNSEASAIVTIKSIPDGAVVPSSSCTVTDSANPGATTSSYITAFTGTPSFSLTEAAKSLTSDRLLKIVCGNFSQDFTIKMSLAVVRNLVSPALEFNFLPSTGTTGTADLYIAGYIPEILKNKLTGKIEPAWICRSNDDSYWVYMPGAVLPKICKRSVSTNDKVRVTIDAKDVAGIGSSPVYDYFFTFSEATLNLGKVQVYGAYTSDNGTTFQFLGDKTTSFPVKALWVFQ